MTVSPAKSKVIWITCPLWRGQSCPRLNAVVARARAVEQVLEFAHLNLQSVPILIASIGVPTTILRSDVRLPDHARCA
jgi:hypothetical protein